jgi:hypothetical protein
VELLHTKNPINWQKTKKDEKRCRGHGAVAERHVGRAKNKKKTKKGIEVTEMWLNVTWGALVPMDMEDEIKAMAKELRSVKVDRKCDAFLGMTDILKKWAIFCPLVREINVSKM